MINKKQPAYKRGKYKPLTKPRADKGLPRAKKEGSLLWWMDRGLTQYQARKKMKEAKLSNL